MLTSRNSAKKACVWQVSQLEELLQLLQVRQGPQGEEDVSCHIQEEGLSVGLSVCLYVNMSFCNVYMSVHKKFIKRKEIIPFLNSNCIFFCVENFPKLSVGLLMWVPIMFLEKIYYHTFVGILSLY